MTTTITKADLSQYVVTGEFECAATISADSESKALKRSKTVHLVFIMENTPLPEIITPALSTKKITWATGARGHFESIVDGSTIKVNFKGGQLPVSPEEAMIAKMQRMTADEQQAFIQGLLAKVKGK